MKKTILLLAVSLVGCVGPDYRDMSAAQINAANKARDASVGCVYAEWLTGKATTVYINIDQKVIEAGGVAISSDCAIIYTNRRENARATD